MMWHEPASSLLVTLATPSIHDDNITSSALDDIPLYDLNGYRHSYKITHFIVVSNHGSHFNVIVRLTDTTQLLHTETLDRRAIVVPFSSIDFKKVAAVFVTRNTHAQPYLELQLNFYSIFFFTEEHMLHVIKVICLALLNNSPCCRNVDCKHSLI